MITIAIIISSILVSYIVLLVLIVVTWTNQSSKLNFLNSSIKFSILIPVRNEEKNVSHCIQSILDCDYPIDLREIIVINDHSDDNTLSELKKFDAGIKIVHSNAVGKKAALSEGINNSTFNFIVTTDADCIVPTKWLQNLASIYTKDSPTIISGPVIIIRNNVCTSDFEYLETAGLMAVSYFGIKNKLFYLGNGANFSFTRSFFNEANGFEESKHFASGDDVFLLKKAEELNHNIVFLQNNVSVVKTQSQQSWKALLEQRKRWATKTKTYANTKLILVQGIVFLVNVSLPILVILSIFLLSKFYFICFLLVLICKLLVDYFYLKIITKFFDDMVSFKSYFIAFFINFYLYLYMSFYALFPTKYKWKDRNVN